MKRNVFRNTTISAGLIALLLSSCKKEEAPAVTLPPTEVQVTKPITKDVNISQEYVATLRGTEDATIRAQVSGYLISKNYKDGSYVNKGDVLFQIDERPFIAVLQQAQGTLARAQALQEKYKLDVIRYEPLVSTGAVGEKQLDDARSSLLEAEASVLTAKAAIEQAEINLQFTTIKAPISGLTGIAKPSIGDLLSPSASEPLTMISAIDPIRVDFAIAEQDLLDSYETFDGKVKGPKDFSLILSNGSAYPLKGKPIAIDRNVNTDTGTINIVGHIPNPDHLLRPGMYVRVQSVAKTIKNATLVPPRSIFQLQNTNFVLITIPAGDGLFDVKLLPVMKGAVDTDMKERYQVISPLRGEFPKDMTVVVEGTTQAQMRMDGKGKVTVKEYVDKIAGQPNGEENQESQQSDKE